MPYWQVFEETLPYYLAMGMTADEFWNQDSSLVVGYRQAEEIRKDKANHQAWLTGLYVFNAINAAFAKRGSGVTYPNEPIDLYGRKEKQKRQEHVDKDQEAWEQAEKIRARMMAFIAGRKQAQEETDGSPIKKEEKGANSDGAESDA